MKLVDFAREGIAVHPDALGRFADVAFAVLERARQKRAIELAPGVGVVNAARDHEVDELLELGLHAWNVFPLIRSYASTYLSRVRCATSGGREGTGGCLFQPIDSSQSRTYCLSKLGWLLPGSYLSAGQNRDESGVKTSSIRTSSLPSMPNSNFVSAMMMPRVFA